MPNPPLPMDDPALKAAYNMATAAILATVQAFELTTGRVVDRLDLEGREVIVSFLPLDTEAETD